MGAWGTGIFSDDIALDVRGAFRELIAAGRSPEEATQEIRVAYEMVEPVEAHDSPAWLALAVTQWKMGRIVEDVRDTALRAIELELQEPMFEGADVRKRAAVLAKTRKQLTSQPPVPRRVRAERFAQTPFSVGDVLRYTTTTGRQVALWAIYEDRHANFAHVSLNTLFRLQAIGDPALPPLEEIVTQPPLVTTTTEHGNRRVHELFLMQPQDATGPAWEVLGNVPFPDPVKSLIGRPLDVLRVKGRGGRMPTPDETFERWFAASRVVHPEATAVQRFIDLMPPLPAHERAWTGWATHKAWELSGELAIELHAGNDAQCIQALALVERCLADEDPAARRIALTVLDGLLNTATHPDVAFDRDDLARHMGSASQRAAIRLDKAWAAVEPTTERPLHLRRTPAEDPEAATFHTDWLWDARRDSRDLGDGTYRVSGVAAIDLGVLDTRPSPESTVE